LVDHSNSPSYPLTAGTQQLRDAIRKWASDRLGATGEFDVLPLIGSKEFVAWLPTILQSKKVLFPKVAYPTYNVGAIIAAADPVAVDIDARSWPDSDLAWINSPSNPTGRVHTESELKAAIEYARTHKTPVVSDECYLEFGDKAQPFSILSFTDGDNSNLLAVHSLSKRSSMAGYRGAFVIGDPALIKKILEIRKHAGMMVPLPIQHAMIAALSDDAHVQEQRARYNNRRKTLAPALESIGFRIDHSDAGLYIWCTRGEDSWKSVEALAELGILVTPGIFYGNDGAQHVRIAMTATDNAIADAATRISASKA
jgi:succinyldiaminopimelate transaminase